jgi:hypothetical protein
MKSFIATDEKLFFFSTYLMLRKSVKEKYTAICQELDVISMASRESQSSRSLRRGSTAVRLLGLRVRIDDSILWVLCVVR